MKNLPIPLLTFLAVQICTAVWCGSQIDHKVRLVEENRRFIDSVIIPSYKINTNWNNPHFETWVKSGGWKNK